MRSISTRIVAAVLAVAVPAAASAGQAGQTAGASAAGAVKQGPIGAAVANASRDIAAAQRTEDRSRGRFWTGIGLIAGGAILGTLSALELGDDETGPDDGEDFDESDDGEDSDGWGSKAMLGGGIAAATLGGVLLMTGSKKSGPQVAVKRGAFAVRHTVRF